MCVTWTTHHPVGPLSLGHVLHPEVDQMLDPQTAGVLRQVQQVEVKGEVAFFDLRAAVVHHGLLHLLMVIRLRHHEPGTNHRGALERGGSSPSVQFS